MQFQIVLSVQQIKSGILTQNHFQFSDLLYFFIFYYLYQLFVNNFQDINLVSQMKENPRSTGWCTRLILVFLTILALFIFYCDVTFPPHLKKQSAELFQSHPVRDLSKYILDSSTLQNSVYFNDPALGMCEDVEIDSNDIAYCVNHRSQIFSIDVKTKQITKLGEVGKGRSYGYRLSRDQKFLYFMNSQLGLCQYNIQTKSIKSLVSSYNGEFLNALNSIQTHPSKPEVLYLTQSNPQIPMVLYNIDILLNRPFGRLYQFNKKTQKIELFADGLYFANGIAFQQYKGLPTLLLAESNRLRVLRIYLQGQKRGQKQIAVDKLDVYLDNVKMNQKGEIWIAGPVPRDQINYYIDHHPWTRTIISRLPPIVLKLVANTKYMGGLKLSFSQDKVVSGVNYYLWNSLPDFKFVTSINQKNGRLYLSSLDSNGILVINDWKNIENSRKDQQKPQTKQEL